MPSSGAALQKAQPGGFQRECWSFERLLRQWLLEHHPGRVPEGRAQAHTGDWLLEGSLGGCGAGFLKVLSGSLAPGLGKVFTAR